MKDNEHHYLIGWTDEGKVIYLHFRKEKIGQPATTVFHEPVETPYVRLSFTFSLASPYWGVHRKNHRRAVQGATCVGAGTDWSLGAVVRPAEGFTTESVRTLRQMAEEWHLNDMQAGCAHMTPAPVGDTGWGFRIGAIDSPDSENPMLAYYTVNRALVCPHTNYRFGLGWLVKPVPNDTLRTVENILKGKELS